MYIPTRQLSQKVDALLFQESINLLSSKICCKRDCMQPFFRLKIRQLREYMYRQMEFELRNHLKHPPVDPCECSRMLGGNIGGGGCLFSSVEAHNGCAKDNILLLC